ncbi:hypothetical protein [Myroides odoratimimus]|uniref:hypothetical protein n=1 Tax=Myroides odoratimimus TaxID=76832 RepID=UPI0031019A8E
MKTIIYIKSLHRPYNQNLNSIKWVCKFVRNKNSNNEIFKSDFYINFYIYTIRKLFNLYKKSDFSFIVHGIPSSESVVKVYKYLFLLKKENRKEAITKALSNRENDIDRAIFSTYKATSYFINLAKDKLQFINSENSLNKIGSDLIEVRSNDFKINNNESKIFFYSILNNDYHFFISLLLLKKYEKKAKDLSLSQLHYEFLLNHFGIKHFNFTEASQSNFNTVREYWIEDLKILDKNNNIRKMFLEIILKHPLNDQYIDIKKGICTFYKEKIVVKTKLKKKINLFLSIYINSAKNELGFVSLSIIANQMKMSKKTFQDFLSHFYEEEKNNYNIFFNNIVQSYSLKNQYLIRNRPVVNIRIKELNN